VSSSFPRKRESSVFVTNAAGSPLSRDDDRVCGVHSRRSGFSHLTDGARHHDLRK
jgi:hypothetical protein